LFGIGRSVMLCIQGIPLFNTRVFATLGT
jgi:hypothetical protein